MTSKALIEKLIELDKSDFEIMPRIIHIETRSRCNGTCSFCPASALTDARSDELMEIDLFIKIINELSLIGYSNRLSIYNNNEPFLDKRINHLINIARDLLPKAYLELKTNGTLINIQKVLLAFNSGLDRLYINDYVDMSKTKKHSKNIITLKNELEKIRRFGKNIKDSNDFDRVTIQIRDKGAILGSRAGNSPNKQIKVNPKKASPCIRPCEMMTINPQGDVSVCSEDYDCSIKMGNLYENSLMEIWKSKKWGILRNELLKGNRSINKTCSKCDYHGNSNEILEEYGFTNSIPIFKRIINKAIKLINKP